MTNAQSRPEQVISEGHNHDNIMIKDQGAGTPESTQYLSLKLRVT
jgi:hypothetical protein